MNKRATPSQLQKKVSLTQRLVSSQFKSPLSRQAKDSKKELSEVDLRSEVEDLQKKLNDTNENIKQLENRGLKDSELQIHIDKLHEYNEIKDVGQMVLGRIAVLEGVQTKDLYKKIVINNQVSSEQNRDSPNINTGRVGFLVNSNTHLSNMAEGDSSENNQWYLIGPVDVLKSRPCQKVYLKGGQGLALFFVEPNKFFLTNAACPHAHGPLEQGDIEEVAGSYKVVCPLHFYSFDVVTGESHTGLKLGTYKTEIRDGEVYGFTPEPITLKRP